MGLTEVESSVSSIGSVYKLVCSVLELYFLSVIAKLSCC